MSFLGEAKLGHTQNINHYGIVMHRFRGNLMCLSNPVEVTDKIIKALVYCRIYPFTVHYQAIMFYSTSLSIE